MFGLAAMTSSVARSEEPKADDAETKNAAESLSPAELIVRLTQQNFSDEHMTEDFLTALRSYIERNLEYSATLDAFGLTNGDSPGPMMVMSNDRG